MSKQSLTVHIIVTAEESNSAYRPAEAASKVCMARLSYSRLLVVAQAKPSRGAGSCCRHHDAPAQAQASHSWCDP